MGKFSPSNTSTPDLDVDDGTISVDADNNKVGIGTTSPKTKLTVEGALTLKEQSGADSDNAAYGQVWVKTATPNQLYFTTDAGNDIQITDGTSLAGGGGGSARSVAGDTDNAIITWVTSDNTFAAEANLLYDGTRVELKNVADDTAGGILRLNNTHAGNDGTDSDVCGIIEFYGMDDGTPTATEYARITGEVEDASSGAEGGRLTLSVASHDAGLEAGLILVDGNADGEVDATIGNGSNSVTTVAGSLLLTTVAAAGEDTDKFLVLDSSGNVDYRAGTDVASDIGAVTTSAANSFTALQTITKDTDGEFVALKLINQSDANSTAGIVAMQFDLEDTGGTAVDSGKIAVKKNEAFTATASTQDSNMVFSTSLNGTLTEHMTLDSAGNLSVGSILATDVKIGEDDQTKIDFEDANKINFYANNSKEVELAENSLSPGSNDGTALGTTSLGWSDLFLASGGVVDFNNGDMTITHSSNKLDISGGTVEFNPINDHPGVLVDCNVTDTSDTTVTALSIDYDKTGASTGNNTMYGVFMDIDNGTATNGVNTMVGMNLTPTLTHAADAGTPTVKGITMTVTGGTNGASTATGMEITATGADTNNGVIVNCADGGTDLTLLSSADTGDKCTIATTTHGATTITTIDDDSHAADLTLTVDGDTIIQAEGTTVARAVGTAAGSTTNVTKAFSALRPYIVMTADTQLYAGDSGAIIVFNDADGAVATLPDAGTAANVGCTFTFLVKVSATSNSHKIVCADTSNEVIFGQIHSYKSAGMGATVTATPFNSGGSTSAIIFNGTTTGGIYSEVTVTAVAADTWVVTNGKAIYVSGTQGTPFADS